jgi:hypothetical protein
VRPLARVVLLLGAAAIALFLFRSAPRDVRLVYGLGRPDAVTEVDVAIERGGEVVRRTELRFPRGAPAEVSHEVRLPDGDYTLRLELVGPDGGSARSVTRPLAVVESGTVVVPVAP